MSVKNKLVKWCVMMVCVGWVGCGPAYPVKEKKEGLSPEQGVNPNPPPAEGDQPIPAPPSEPQASVSPPGPITVSLQPVIVSSEGSQGLVPDPALKQKSELLQVSLVKQSGIYQASPAYGLFDESKVNFADIFPGRIHRSGSDLVLAQPIQLERQASGLYRDVLLVVHEKFGEQRVDEIRVWVGTRHINNSESAYADPTVARSDRRNGRFFVSFLEALKAREVDAFQAISKTETQTFKLELLFTDRSTENLLFKFRIGGNES